MKYAQPANREIKDDEALFRAFVCDEVKILDEEKRQIDFVISTEAVDRYGDIIRAKGFDLKAYRKNPIILFAHNSHIPPIGRAVKVSKGDGALRATAEFMSQDLSEFAFSIFRMYQEKFLRAVSVGFLPTKWEVMLDDDGIFLGIEFLKQELLEFSAVPIPANPEALVEARRLGINMTPIRSWAEKVLDEWGDTGPLMTSCYGVDRKLMETIRRKASGVGVTINVPLDVQDKLLAGNLERFKDESEKSNLPVVVENENKDDEVSSEEDTDSLIDVWFKDLPVVEDIGDITEPIIMRTEDDKTFVDKAPEKALFTVGVLKVKVPAVVGIIDLARKGVEVDLSGGLINIPNGDDTLVYKAVGRSSHSEGVVVGVAMFEPFGKDAPFKVPEGELDDKTVLVIPAAAGLGGTGIGDTVELKDGQVASLDVDEVSTEEIVAAKLHNASLLEGVVEVEQDDNEDHDEDVGLEDVAACCFVIESSLSTLEQTLDRTTRLGQCFSRAELRRLRFLCQEFNHVITQINKIVGSETEKDKPTIDDGKNGLTLDQLKNMLSSPEFAEQVKSATTKALEKARGRLD